MCSQLETDVLIVGGGPVGLALAIELGQRGVRSIVVDKGGRAGKQPRAKTTNVRSMEHMRRWGLAAALAEACPLPPDHPREVAFRTKLYGHEITRFENAFNGARVKDERFPEPAEWIPQYKVEGVLREGAARLPAVTLLEDAEFTGFEETAELTLASVEAVADRAPTTIRCRYLVGADGARSTVRTCLGIEMEGEHALAQHLTVIFKSPQLSRDPPGRGAIMYWTVSPDCPGGLGPLDDSDTWYFGLPWPSGGQASPEEMGRLLQVTVGKPIEYEILRADYWSAHSLLATRYRSGRSFLVGDACHLHPPFGGFGMNMGLSDAVDLGWKLAAVLQGWGGPALLDSYETERRPVHQRTIEEAVINHGVLSTDLVRASVDDEGPGGDAARRALAEEIVATKAREFYTLGVVLGANYEQSPLVAREAEPGPPPHFSDYAPTAHAGHLAPHAWMPDGSSLFDHFGPDFTLLLTDAAAEAAASEIAGLARSCGLPLSVLRVAGPDLRGLYGAPLALVRPDQHVAWRGQAADEELRRIVGVMTGAASGAASARPAEALAAGAGIGQS